MKRILFFLISLFLLASCDYPYALDNGRYRCGKEYYNNKLTFRNEDLIGTWGCTDIMFGNYEVKEMAVNNENEANVILQERGTTSRFNKTFKYILSGKYIRFYSKYTDKYGVGDGPYEFKIREYIPGSLFLEDWIGVHEVRLYSIYCEY